jgi:hypothetical protein
VNLRETEYRGVDWFQRAQDRVHWSVLVNMIMKFSSVKGGKFLVRKNSSHILKKDSVPLDLHHSFHTHTNTGEAHNFGSF